MGERTKGASCTDGEIQDYFQGWGALGCYLCFSQPT